MQHWDVSILIAHLDSNVLQRETPLGGTVCPGQLIPECYVHFI